jgi:hypothetical protein
MNGPDRDEATRLAGVVVGSTLVLTATFIGVVALVSGGNPRLGTRLPFYVLAMALGFVAWVVASEQRYGKRADGRSVLGTAAATSLVVFVVVTLAGEGLVFASDNPGEVVLSELFLYFLAAGLIGTGLGYWGLRHWREFARVRPGGSGARL